MSNSTTNSTTPSLPAGAQFHHVFKLIICGDSGVGKSCLLLRFTDDTFQHTESTIAVDFRTKAVVHRDSGMRIKLQIWDTAGQETFRSISRAYYRGAHGVMIVFDVTDERSFENVESWIQTVDVYAPNDVCRVLVGTKADFEDRRVVDYDRASKFAKERGIAYFETSALTGLNVEQAFHGLMAAIVDQVQKNSGVNPAGNAAGGSSSSGGRGSDEDNRHGGSGRVDVGNSQQDKKQKKGCC
eukprot:ANDGO_06027.mRNA.1 Ras-related protein RABD2a